MTDWQDRALCREVDPELFYPVGGSAEAVMQTVEAKSICRSCPVLETCQDWALDTREKWGVWGGLTERERRTILRQRDREAREKKDKAERDALIVRLAARGGMTVAQIASMAGCDSRTVHRVTAAHRAQYQPAA